MCKTPVIPDEIESAHRVWFRMGRLLNWTVVVLGVVSISSSLAVATFTEIDVRYLRVLAFVAALSAGFLTSFGLVSKNAQIWAGWRGLGAAMMRYKEGIIDIDKLIEEYEKAEALIGNPTVNTKT